MITFQMPFELLPNVILLAEEAGRMLAAEFSRPGGPRGTGDHADIDDEIEALLRDRLLALFPARRLGEETGALTGPGGPFCWLVDPHDGTRAFLDGERGSAVSVALLRDGVPVLGVVHAPLSPDRGPDTIAWAEGAESVTRNGQPAPRLKSEGTLSAGEIVFVSHAVHRLPPRPRRRGRRHRHCVPEWSVRLGLRRRPRLAPRRRRNPGGPARPRDSLLD